MTGISILWAEVVWSALVIATAAMLWLWLMERTHRHLLFMACSSASVALGMLANLLPVAIEYRIALNAAFFVVAILLVFEGLTRRAGRLPDRVSILAPAGVGLLGVLALAVGHRGLRWEIRLQDATAAVVLAIGVYQARLLTNGRRGDRALGFICLFTVGYLAIRSWFGLDDTALASGEHSSFDVFTPPFVIIFAGIIVCTVATFIVQEVGTVIDTLRRERDTDALTDVLNRRGFQNAVQRRLTAAGQAPSSLVVFDLDKFKPVNDRYGHAAGDAVLRDFGALLCASVGHADLVGRIGGDEFAIYLHGLTGRDAEATAHRIRADLARSGVPNSLAAELITASFGLATTSPGQDFADLLAVADSQLYRAKRAEGGQR